MKDPAELEELISIYALGALEGKELEVVETLLASGDPDAHELLEKYQDVASHISYSSRGRMPDESLRGKVFKEILGSKVHTINESKPPFWKRFQLVGFSVGAALAAMLILVLFSSGQFIDQGLGAKRHRIADLEKVMHQQRLTIASLKVTLEKKELELGELEENYARLDELSEFLEEPGVHVIQLANLHTDEDAGGGVLYDTDDNQAMFYCLDLEHPPEGETYQLWVRADGVHKSVSVFKVDKRGSGVVRLEAVSDFGDIEHYSVTLEPEGGAEKPSDKLIFAGDHRGSNL